MSSSYIPASSSVLDLPECTSAPSGSRARTAALAPSTSATTRTSKFRSRSLVASASNCALSAGIVYPAACFSIMNNSPFRAPAQARAERPKCADGEDTRTGGQGDDNGQGDVLSRDPPQREPQALGEHQARAAQGEGTVPQGQRCCLDEQAIDSGCPGGAEPGDQQECQGQA